MKDNNELYKIINEAIINLQNKSISFKDFLDVQAKFYKYSTANAILIASQMPKATLIKDSLAWERESIKISKKAKPIYILEPVFDGEKRIIDYHSKEMYDISQTNAKNKNIKYDNRTLLKAFLHNNLAEIKAVDDFDDSNLNASHEKIGDNNIIYIRRGMDYNMIFKSLAYELAKLEYTPSSDEEMDNFKVTSIAYILCKIHNLDVSSYSFDKLPKSFINNSSIEARKDLVEIKNIVNKINEGIDEYLQRISINRSRGYSR